ncbi:phage head closure protein [Clostridium botulinum]|uniref:Head-tail adaptor protein n=1 Tax=Clostridium botulinum TaxID=1491 RepID=A0A9Q1ZBI3_CLOBO|nr:phage head closure protein [Clostridium botulinum]AEB75898.1 phage head-tail adaptor, putative [Clostridium botulinum BKT015925]KEH97210.1 head-tail adaptor protein [Clostridium botulinum D str. 16868]KEI04680.1 head-tail adaptor protein [Clostridium botulinum C/D str. Sp77]KLU76769.1 head-tail adaptor protein [Clostridium botulinum V891]KOA75204.1 head-tail adaptor protein [Clostridium botulinum]
MDTSRAPSFSIMEIAKKDNGIGGKIENQTKLFEIKGFLDLLTGDETNTNNAFIQESSHILITDYREDIRNKNWMVDSNGNRYNIVLVDDPVSMHNHLELYLKFIGEHNV